MVQAENLLMHGADVNGSPTELPGVFPSRLHRQYAMHRQDPFYISRNMRHQDLLPNRAKIYLKGEMNRPLIEAILNGKMAYIERLLQAHDLTLTADAAAFNDREVRNASPLMLAAYLGQLETVEALLTRGANINEVDNFRESAIFYALRGNQPAVFYFLLQQPGVDITLNNLSGQSLLELMQDFNYPELQELCNPFEKLEQLIINHPEELSRRLFSLINRRMPTLVRGLKEKEEIIPCLTQLRLQSRAQLGHSLFQSASAPLENQDYFQDTFITLCEHHFQTPFITEGRDDSPYLVMGCQNGTYEIRHNPYSIRRAYHMLMVAHQLRHLDSCSVDVLLDFVS